LWFFLFKYAEIIKLWLFYLPKAFVSGYNARLPAWGSNLLPEMAALLSTHLCLNAHGNNNRF